MDKPTLYKVSEEKKLNPSRILVLNTIPLSKVEFEKDVQKPSFFQKLFGKQNAREFANLRVNEDYLKTWEEYEHVIVLPIFKELLQINESSATIDYNVTFDCFKEAVLSGHFDVIFLAAHHIVSSKGEFIEFKDDGIPIKEIYEFLKKLKHPVSLIFIVCQSNEFEGLKKGIVEDECIASIATAYWNIPVILGYRFIKTWVLCVNGNNSLSEAYSRAIQIFLS